MKRNIKKASITIANFLPALMSGTELEFFSKSNITNSQFITLMAVFHAGKCTMSHLARNLHVKMPTVTGLIDRLIKLNLVRRSTCEMDRRKVYIELTKKGINHIGKFKTVVRHRWTMLLSTLSPTEVRSFQNILKKLNRNIKR